MTILKCGCKINDPGFSDDWIEFCSLHDAAPELLKALRIAIKMLQAAKCTAAVLNPLEETLAKATKD